MTWFAHQRLMKRLATHLGRGEHAQVVECAESALRDRPDDKVVLSLMARSLDELGQHDEAANVRRLVLAIDPHDRESLFLLGRHHEGMRDLEVAADLYERFLNSPERSYPLVDSDYCFMRFAARLLGGKPEVIEYAARDASSRIDREGLARQKHAARYLFLRARRRSAPKKVPPAF